MLDLSFQLERLSYRHQTRLETRKVDSPDSSTSTFLSRFNDSKNSITSHLQTTTDPSRLPDISALEKLIAENSYSLPSYEELFGGVDGVCGGGEAFGGSDGGDGDKFDGEGGLVDGLAIGGRGEFVCRVNTGGGGGELLGGLDISDGGDDELVSGLDATGGGEGGAGVDVNGRGDVFRGGGGEIGGCAGGDGVEGVDGSSGFALGSEGIEEDLEAAALSNERGNKGNANDFKWLRDVQSPNWSVLSEDKRLGTVDLADLGRGNGAS
ncbi:hypothetical protein Pint_16660 [Pistacia integerrima]|uniref:Uncharacterized protein n=1 Tax=Pistacia integerrima TaxID=434235 RepID=A0ACC0ZAU6_9ROSI|nr:hypothetical protein Pint_16660 [Pistacia integerrima]